jgi:hypothetical protein
MRYTASNRSRPLSEFARRRTAAMGNAPPGYDETQPEKPLGGGMDGLKLEIEDVKTAPHMGNSS